MESLFALTLAVGLSAACGFRVFLPPFLVGLASATGHLPLAESLQWLSSPLALTCFGFATLIEIGAYFIPVLDHALDTIAAPAAVVAGVIVSASVLVDVPPALRWTLAAMVAGTVTTPIELATTAARVGSTATTGGLGNPVFSAGETTSAGLIVATSLLLPVLAAVIAVVIVVLSVIVLRKGIAYLRGVRGPA